MAWTAPRTWTTAEVVTAAIMNTHVRDNLLESAAAKVTTAGDLVYGTGANALARLAVGSSSGHLVSTGSAPVWRVPQEAVNYGDNSTSQADTSTTLGLVWGSSTLPDINTITTGTAALIIVSADRVSNSTAGAQVQLAYNISGATTVSASDTTGSYFESSNANDNGNAVVARLQSLTAGANRISMYARVTSGTGTIIRPRLVVIPF